MKSVPLKIVIADDHPIFRRGLCEVIDAFEFSFEELKREAIENLDLKHDGFGRKVVMEFT